MPAIRRREKNGVMCGVYWKCSPKVIGICSVSPGIEARANVKQMLPLQGSDYIAVLPIGYEKRLIFRVFFNGCLHFAFVFRFALIVENLTAQSTECHRGIGGGLTFWHILCVQKTGSNVKPSSCFADVADQMVRWNKQSAECGVRSEECGVWKIRSVENEECGKCVENFNFPFKFPILVMSMLSVVNIYKYIYMRGNEWQACTDSLCGFCGPPRITTLNYIFALTRALRELPLFVWYCRRFQINRFFGGLFWFRWPMYRGLGCDGGGLFSVPISSFCMSSIRWSFRMSLSVLQRNSGVLGGVMSISSFSP